jgi:hypothetical protein
MGLRQAAQRLTRRSVYVLVLVPVNTDRVDVEHLPNALCEFVTEIGLGVVPFACTQLM